MLLESFYYQNYLSITLKLVVGFSIRIFA